MNDDPVVVVDSRADYNEILFVCRMSFHCRQQRGVTTSAAFDIEPAARLLSLLLDNNFFCYNCCFFKNIHIDPKFNFVMNEKKKFPKFCRRHRSATREHYRLTAATIRAVFAAQPAVARAFRTLVCCCCCETSSDEMFVL